MIYLILSRSRIDPHVGKICGFEPSFIMKRSLNFEQRFIELYNQHADDVFRYCLVRLRDRDKSLDITQEVFCKLWNEYTKHEFVHIENIRGFIFRIARNTLIDSVRKKTSLPFSFLVGSQGSTESHLEPVNLFSDIPTHEQRHAETELLDCLDLLEPHHREILVYKFIHEMSVPEIADTLNISENATSVRIHRALEHARKKLHHLYE